MTITKNKIGKFLGVKGVRQRDLFFYLKDKGIPKVSRQHISIYVSGEHNPRRFSEMRKGICEFFGLEDKEIFDNGY